MATQSTALVPVNKVVTAMPPSAYMLPTSEEAWVTLARDMALLKKGSNCLMARVYHYLESLPPIAKDDSLVTLSSIARVFGVKVAAIKHVVSRACDCLRANQIPAVVKHDLSGLRDGVYYTAKRGNRILGVTVNPLRDAALDTVRAVREGKVNPLLLAASAAAGSLNG